MTGALSEGGVPGGQTGTVQFNGGRRLTVRAGCAAWLLFAVPVGLSFLALVTLINRYDGVSYGRHAAWIRSAIGWRYSRPVVLLPVLLQLPGLWGEIPVTVQLVWLLVGLAACEVYSVCFHRESYIAAFEPGWIPGGAAPLGGVPSRRADRRLHYMIRVQVFYLVPLVAASLLVAASSPAAGWILLFAFVAKYVAPAWTDYEAYFHWDMHCSVLSMPGRPWLTQFWRGLCEWCLGPAVGSLPYLYSIEHLALHHPSNAGPRDIHSPLPYRRTSIVEFCHYAVKTVAILATTAGVMQHRRLGARQRLRLFGGAASVWVVAAVSIGTGKSLGFWLIMVIIYRGTNTAIAQYVWHGLHDGTGKSHPLSTTILWLPGVPGAPGAPAEIVATGSSPVGGDTDPVHYVEGLLDVVPTAGSDWAFFDNYHLVHHLHPRAHFTEYPALLNRDLPRVVASGSPVMRLDGYGSFFSDLMAGDLKNVAVNYVVPAGLDGVSCDEISRRLEPWPGARSVVADVTETPLGHLVDYFLSGGWRAVRREHQRS